MTDFEAQWFLDELLKMKNNTHYRAWGTIFDLFQPGAEHHIITDKLKAFRAAWGSLSPELKDEVRTRLVLER